MRRFFVGFAAAAFLTACGPKVAKETEAAEASAAAADKAAGAASAAGFKLEALAENEGAVQGCQTMLSLDGAGADVFRASAADADAPAFLKIGGAVIQLDLVSSSGDEKSHLRKFESADKSTSAIESLTTGAAHPESDSVEQTGFLEVTHNGQTQRFAVQGGTAC